MYLSHKGYTKEYTMINALVIASIAVSLILFVLKYTTGPCACTHDRTAHKHYRPGTDCGRCECKRLRVAR